jgi:hypothetical protein
VGRYRNQAESANSLMISGEISAKMTVKAPSEAIGQGDVPMRPSDLRAIRDGAIVGVLQVPLLERAGRLFRHKAWRRSIDRGARHPVVPPRMWPGMAARRG